MIGTEETLFETIFMRYYALVYQVAYRCTGRRDEAEDIVQEVFLRFHHTPPLMLNEEACKGWLCRVTTNIALNNIRTEKRRNAREESCSSYDNVDAQYMQSPEEHVLQEEHGQIIRAILADLSEQQRNLLVLRSVGFSYAKIAQAIDITPTSVGPLMTRAVREFRRRYVKQMASE